MKIRYWAKHCHERGLKRLTSVRRHSKFFLIHLGLVIPAVFLLISCGDLDQGQNSAPKPWPTDPTQANFQLWSQNWDGESWILGLRTRQVKEQSLVQQFANSFESNWNSWGAVVPLPGGLAGRTLGSTWEVSRTPLDDSKCKGRSCPSFAFVKLKSDRAPWATAFAMSALEKYGLQHTKSSGRFDLLVKTFEGMPEVLYAEPDLVALPINLKVGALPAGTLAIPVSTPTTALAVPAPIPATALAEPEVSPVPDPAPDPGSQKEPEKNYQEFLNEIRVLDLEKELAKRNIQPREVVVAVLDTGVDNTNPYLKERMFALPGRTPGQKPSPGTLDGNTYLMDANGLDASWSSATKAEVTALSPGSADVGGPGADCPKVPGAGEGSKDFLRSPSGTGCGHGTHVSGIVAASEFNSDTWDALGRGVCPSCKILAVRVAETTTEQGPKNNGPIRDSAQIRGIQFVLGLKRPNGTLYTNVVNMSIGQYTSNRSMRAVIDGLDENGVVIVAAASNHNTDRPSYPAAYEPVIGVCATVSSKPLIKGISKRQKYAKANFSNYGQWVKICAPGEDIDSTWPGTTQLYPSNGTSMSSPIVAGAAAYYMGIADALKIGELNRNKKVRDDLLKWSNWSALYASKDNEPYQFVLPDGSGVEFLGRGFLDIANAVLQTRNTDNERKSAPTDQISGGCVVSSISQTFAQSLNLFWGSVPLMLGSFWMFVSVLGSLRWRRSRRSGAT